MAHNDRNSEAKGEDNVRSLKRIIFPKSPAEPHSMRNREECCPGYSAESHRGFNTSY